MESVLKTIVYYDCLDYPLTFEELRFFSFKGGQKEISDSLGSLIKKGLIEESNGFYFLKARKNLIEIRNERNQIAKEKWQKTFKAVQWLRMIPYLRAVFASGSLALANTSKESDLDVLVAVKHGRIWTARILVVLFLSFLGIRRTRYEKIAPDKICLNHFITDKSLYIPRKSIYTAQLYARLVPILVDDQELINQFCEANKWIGDYVVGWPECLKTLNPKLETLNKLKTQNSKLKTFGEKILDTKFGDWLENILRKYQLRRINSFHLTHKPGGRVKADDESLEFHPDSPELKIIERYNKKMIELGFEGLAKEADSGLTRANNYAI